VNSLSNLFEYAVLTRARGTGQEVNCFFDKTTTHQV